MPFNLCIYYKQLPEKDTFFKNDYRIRKSLRRLLGKHRKGGIELVFLNLIASLKKLKIPHTINKPFEKLSEKDVPIVLGVGKSCLDGYVRSNKIIAGIALMTHPSEWPTFCKDYPIAKYLQHSEWTKDIYAPYYGQQICDTWFSGIDTEFWCPTSTVEKNIDFLIYVKFHWDMTNKYKLLLNPILERLRTGKYSYEIIHYGKYKQRQYKDLLNKSKSMIFLSEHESQGFACCEAMAMNVSIFAWDQEKCMDPELFKLNNYYIPATSVPFFSSECGLKFNDFVSFEEKIDHFISLRNENYFKPRHFVFNNLSLIKSGERMLAIVKQVYKDFKY